MPFFRPIKIYSFAYSALRLSTPVAVAVGVGVGVDVDVDVGFVWWCFGNLSTIVANDEDSKANVALFLKICRPFSDSVRDNFFVCLCSILFDYGDN